MSPTLPRKVAVVTGSGTGIGRAIARRLAREGAKVAITGRRRDKLDETAAQIRAAGGTCLVQPLDVCDRQAVDAAFVKVRAELGGLDILVNNAGAGGPNACATPGEERWDEIVRTNLDGPYFCVRAALPHLPDGGRIVNISSVLGRFGVPGYTAYCASKHGLLGFTKALALELAPRAITVNAICPGWVDTEMAHAGLQGLAAATNVTFAEARRNAMAAVPLNRMLDPDEIAGLVAWICGPEASGMTAQAVSLCGGATMI